VFIRRTAFATTASLCLLLGLAGNAVSQQPGAPLHRYQVRAVFTNEGLKNFQKQPPTALKAGVEKYLESTGGKLESWYFDFSEGTAYAVVYYPDDIAATTSLLSTNSTGFVRVTLRPLLSAEEADKAVAKLPAVRAPQQQ
jgi:uncharacterized protein with GYD domain